MSEMSLGMLMIGHPQLSLTREHEELRSVARSFFLANTSIADALTEVRDRGGFDRSLWRRMSEDLGFAGLSLPENVGGLGASALEQSVVIEEMGRALARSPYLASVVLAAPTLLDSRDQYAVGELVPQIVAGELVATCAPFGFVGSTAVGDAAVHRLTGQQKLVLDATVADGVIVFAMMDAGLTAYWVESRAEGMMVTPSPGLDWLRPLGTLTFTDTPARALGQPGRGAELRHAARVRAAFALSAEQVGIAQRCLDMAVEYAGQRRQFDRPIATFQVIQHKCADMLVEVERARSSSRYLAYCLASDGPASPSAESVTAAAAASYVCGKSSVEVAKANIQIHGGIGYTWDHPAHWYLRRAKSSQLLLGSPSSQLTHLAERAGITSGIA